MTNRLLLRAALRLAIVCSAWGWTPAPGAAQTGTAGAPAVEVFPGWERQKESAPDSGSEAASRASRAGAPLEMLLDSVWYVIHSSPPSYHSWQFQASGGTGTYTWAVESGSLPPGLTLSASGWLTGQVATTGVYPAVVSVASGAEKVSRRVRFFVLPSSGYTITNTHNQAAGAVGQPYSHRFGVTGNTFYDEFRYEIISGALPPGLTLSRDGTISGTPTAVGSYSFGVRVTALRDGIRGSDTAWGTSITVYEPLRFATTAFPQAGVGVPYDHRPVVTGGPGGSYLLFISPQYLPPGLTTPGTGYVRGTPTTPGVWKFVIHASSGNLGVSAEFTLAVMGFAAEAARPAGGAGVPYSDDLRVTGALGPVAYAVSDGQLPPGLALDPGSGTLAGTPSQAGTYAFTLAASSGGVTVTRSFTVTIIPPVAIGSASQRASAVVGRPYQDQLQASGGSGSFAWSLVSGELPPGLALGSGGALSGTPTRSGTFEFTARASSPPQSATQGFRIVVHPALAIANESPLGAGELGRPYQETLTAIGGDGGFRWSIAAGSLPPGLSLSEAGALTGSPSAQGDFDFTVRCTSAGAEASKALRITVYPVFSITSDSVRPATAVGYPYADRLQSAGGSGSAAWSLAGGSLPAGLSLAPDGAVTGTPTTPGAYSFSARAASATLVRTRGFSIEVGPALAITSDSLRRAGTVGAAYADTLRASGGLGSPRWRVVAGALPAGIALDSVSGVLGGVPEAAGEAAFTVAAGGGPVQATRRFGMAVRAPELQPAAVIDQLLGAGTLSPDHVRYLDLQGNRNGRLDVGDVRAWLVRTGQLSPVRIPGLPSALDATTPSNHDRR